MVHSAALTVLGPAVLMVLSSRWLFPYPDGMRQRPFSEVTRHQSHVRHGRHLPVSLVQALQTLNFSPFYGALTKVNKRCHAKASESVADPVATWSILELIYKYYNFCKKLLDTCIIIIYFLPFVRHYYHAS